MTHNTSKKDGTSHAHIDREALNRSAGRGAMWRIAGGAWSTVVRLGASMFLARHLTPADFGIFSMALLVHEFVFRFAGLRMGSGVIAKKDLNDDDISTAFWVDGSVRVLLFLTLLLTAPLVEAFIFNKTPGVSKVIQAVSVTFLFSALSCTSGALLYRQMRFGLQEAIGSISALIESGLAVLLVLTTSLGYWALVIGLVSASLFSHLATVVAARWRPRFRFNRGSFHFQFRFGMFSLACSIVEYTEDNIDSMFIGRRFGNRSLGLYQFSVQIPTMMYARLIRPASVVLFPAMSQAQAHLDLVGRGFIKATRIIATLIWPLLAMLAVLCWPTVQVMWGDQWMSIVPLVQIFCIVAALKCVAACPNSVFYALHRPDLPLKLQIGRCIITIILVITLGRLYNLTGVAWGIVIASTYYFFVAWKVTRFCHVSFFKLLWALGSAAILAAISGLCTLVGSKCAFLFWAANPLASLLVGFAAGTAGACLVLYVALPDVWAEILHLLRAVLLPASSKPAPAPAPASQAPNNA